MPNLVEPKERLLPFRIIKINVPRQFLLHMYEIKRTLKRDELLRISRKLVEIDRAQNKLNHLRSIVERAILKRGNT